MGRRIPKEFVPLDLNLPSDAAIRRAGPDAELLYIRGLIYLKRTGSDGFIPAYDLPALAVGLRNVILPPLHSSVSNCGWTTSATTNPAGSADRGSNGTCRSRR